MRIGRLNIPLWIPVLATLVLAAYAFGSWRSRKQLQARRAWISTTAQQLAHAPPGINEVDPRVPQTKWVFPNFLIFSNSWAGYRIHTIHDGDEIGDITLLRTSGGALYMSETHFCTGITEMMRPRPDLEGSMPAPSDEKDFLESYGRLQGWHLVTSNKLPWCVVTVEDALNVRIREKPVRVWISGGDEFNRTTLFDHACTIHGSYVSYAMRWPTEGSLTLDFFDYYNSPRNYPDALRSNYLCSITLKQDPKTGMFRRQSGNLP
jgi:hypothetical protein